VSYRIRRFAPLQAAKVLGILYGVCGLVVTPAMALIATVDPDPSDPEGGVGFVLIFPFLFGAVGLLVGGVGAFLYNLVAGWVGGLEIDLDPGG
jgi:hypothetical protein